MKSFFDNFLKFWHLQYTNALNKHSEWSIVRLYLLVGFIGFCLNIGLLTLALRLGSDPKLAIILGIIASMALTFALDRYFVFSYAKEQSAKTQLVGFLFVCILGSIINYATATTLLVWFPTMLVQAAETIGACIGAAYNYFSLRFLIFNESKES